MLRTVCNRINHGVGAVEIEVRDAWQGYMARQAICASTDHNQTSTIVDIVASGPR
jgi:hypothetical protein